MYRSSTRYTVYVWFFQPDGKKKTWINRDKISAITDAENSPGHSIVQVGTKEYMVHGTADEVVQRLCAEPSK